MVVISKKVEKNCCLLFFIILIAFKSNYVISQEKYVESEYFSWDFTDVEIRDILYSISLDSGISIICDDTVKGNGSIKYFGKEFNTAFDAFLDSCRLYVKKEESLWTVSKINCEEKDGLYYVNCYDLCPYEILEKISEKLNLVITYDQVGNFPISLHLNGLTEEELILSLSKNFGEYEIKNNSVGYHLQQKHNNGEINLYGNSIDIVMTEDNLIKINIKEADFCDIVEILFEKAGSNENFSILSNGHGKIERLVFTCKSFEEALTKICYQAGFKIIKDNDVYYFVEDMESKSNLINGEKYWVTFELAYSDTDEFLPLLYKKFGNLETISLLNKTAFMCRCTEKESNEIKNFINVADIKKSVYLVNLKFLKPQNVIDFLPPVIDKNNLFIGDNNSFLYFRGTEEAYRNLIDQIEVIDKPDQKITYDLLIIQRDQNNQNSFSSSFSSRKMHKGDKHNMSAILGPVLGLNLNVITTFGIAFAADLQASIEENKTRIFADTTLHGVSGKKISFQNTNTYRYRDNNVNPETGEPVYSGVTREIITGIKLDITGWISGEGMITSSVTASISRQGVDNSSISGNPPPTTEKIITTEVTGKSGEPVILSGLILDADSNSSKSVPVLGNIPIIGNLFKNKVKTEEQSQMVIYLVPHFENSFDVVEKTLCTNKKDEVWMEKNISDLVVFVEN